MTGRCLLSLLTVAAASVGCAAPQPPDQGYDSGFLLFGGADSAHDASLPDAVSATDIHIVWIPPLDAVVAADVPQEQDSAEPPPDESAELDAGPDLDSADAKADTYKPDVVLADVKADIKSGDASLPNVTFAQVWSGPLKSGGCTSPACHGKLLPSPSVALQNLLKGQGSGECAGQSFVVPGDPVASLLWQKTQPGFTTCGGKMPPGVAGAGGLPSADAKLIENWIAGGAKP